MEVTAAVLYEGALAHYDVSIQRDGSCNARLTAFKGSQQNAPPDQLTLRKEGRKWMGNVPDKNLPEDLGYAVEMKVPREMVGDEARKREEGHPAS